MALADRLEADQLDETKDTAHATTEGDKLTVFHDSLPVKLTAETGYAPLLEWFGFDPEEWDVDGAVKVSKWQQSKGNEDGTRDVIWCYSYRARFSRKVPSLGLTEDIEAIAEGVRSWKPDYSRATVNKGAEVTFLHQQGDEQTGKKQGGGLAGLVDREQEALERSLARLDDLLRRGVNVAAILDSANGDGIENIFGHYNSQPRTTSTLRTQLALRRDLDIARTKAFAEYDIPIIKAYTKSNHGEIRQAVGQSPHTSESDNYDLIIAENVRAILNETPLADLIEWHIPHDEDWTQITTSGVNVGTSHGHKADRRKLVDWLRDQRDMLLFHEDWKMHLALLGHKHHGHIEEVSGTWLLQTPTMDGGSPYFSSMRGDRAQHGIITAIIGDSLPHGFGEVSFL